MLAKPKRITRKFYTDKFRPEVAAVIQEILVKEKTLFPMLRSVRSALQSAQRLTISDKDAIRDIAQLAKELEIYQKEYDSYSSGDTSIDNINKIVSSTSDDPAQLNSAYKKLLGIVADLLFDLHQEYRTYTSNQRYAPIVKKLMEDLRNEDDKDRWDDIYRKQLDELQNVRDDAREHYYELVEMIKAITYTIREIYKEEERKMIEQENKFSAEECVAHQEEIKRAIYEKCADGEITLEEREKLLKDLQSMVFSENSVEEVFENAVQDYLEDQTSVEEFDTVLTSIYENHPSFAASILDEPIDRLYNMFHENTNDLYHDKLITLQEAKQRSMIFDELCDEEYVASYNESMDEEKAERLQKLQSLRDGFYQMLEFATESLNAGDMTVEEFDSEVANFADTYYENAVDALGYDSSQPSQLTTEGISIGTAALLGTIGVITIGSIIGRIEAKHTQKKLIEIYERDYHPVVCRRDLEYYEPSDTEILRWDPYVKEHVARGWDLGGSYVLKYRGRPFVSLTFISGNDDPNPDVPDDVETMYVVRTYHPEAEKHQMYYYALLLFEGPRVAIPEVTQFVKSVIKGRRLVESAEDVIHTEGVETQIKIIQGISFTMLAAILATLIAIPTGKAINRGLQKRSSKQLSKAYEALRNPKVKWSDLTVERISMEYASELDSSVASAMKKDPAVNGKAFLATYKGKPFMSAVETHVRSSDGYGDVRSYGSHTHLKAYDAEAKKHSDYYASMLLLKKVGIMRPELKRFVKTIIKEAKVTVKETKAAKKFTKESTLDTQAIVEAVESKIREKYEAGEISIDQREELLMQLRTESVEEFANRFFFDPARVGPCSEAGNMYKDLLNFAVLDTEQRMRKNYLKHNPKEAKRVKAAKRLAKQKERQHVKYVNRFDKYLDTITDIRKLRDMKYDYPYDGIERKRIDIRIKELEKESRNE